jgi:Uma2 family endonuclease
MLNEAQFLKVNTSGNIIGLGISEESFMRDYAEFFCEWLDGTVIKMSPVHDRHDKITRYLSYLLGAYLEQKPIGELRQEPFVMRYMFEEDEETKRRDREPDMQIILGKNRENLMPTYMNGAADIVVEVVSPESQQRDYAEKLYEYEKAGVQEYWIIDPLKKEARFYRLNEKQAFVLQEAEDIYHSELLPKLIVDIPTFWQDPAPGPAAVVKAIEAMLSS